jgi:hypothetical protein
VLRLDINQAVLSFTLNTAVYVSGKVLAGRTFPSRQAILLEINSPKTEPFSDGKGPVFCISIFPAPMNIGALPRSVEWA